MRISLYMRMLLWLFANLAVVALLLWLLFKVQLNFGLDSLLTGRAGERITSVSSVIASELRNAPRSDWQETLARFSDSYGIHLSVHAPELRLPEPAAARVPEKVAANFVWRDPFRNSRPPPRRDRRPGEPRGRGEPREPGEPRERRGPPPDQPGRDGSQSVVPPKPLLLKRDDASGHYFAAVEIDVRNHEHRHPLQTVLVLEMESLTGGGFLLDLRSWIVFAIGVVAFSALFWLPFVGGITRYVRRMTDTTEEIAAGNLNARVGAKRGDELGRLGTAINRMARRLEGHVDGQRRFLGDIAHELCSPIARMKMALGVLERHTSEEQATTLGDVQEEAEHMSEMVDELLSFSKASLAGKGEDLRPLALQQVVDDAVRREATPEAEIVVDIPEGLRVLGHERLLLRAVVNLLRNAIRYAGDAGPIRVEARADGDGDDGDGDGMVCLSVIDAGEGIDPEAMEQIFDPFFRPDVHRSRDAGGVGLGLSIVKSCVQSCEGVVRCENLKPVGFAMHVSLKTVPAGMESA